MSKWISVKDQLPSKGGIYLVLFKAPPEWPYSYCVHTRRFWPCDPERAWSKVSHWMPLPEPPEEVNEDD